MRYIVIRKKDLIKVRRYMNIRRCEMDILITMAYTAIMTFVMVKVTELVPSEKK